MEVDGFVARPRSSDLCGEIVLRLASPLSILSRPLDEPPSVRHRLVVDATLHPYRRLATNNVTSRAR